MKKMAHIKTAGQYVGGLVIAAFFVALLSFIFSFLGAIFCAAVAGMMLGALRTQRWLPVPVSLLCPAVIFALMRGMKSDLTERQILLVCLACFCIYWLTHAMGVALFHFERKTQSVAGSLSQTQEVSTSLDAGATSPQTAAALSAAVQKQDGLLNLEMLQGDWSSQADAQVPFRPRRMSIEKEKLTLSAANSKGRFDVLARAQLRLCALGSLPTLLLSEPPAEPGSDAHVCI